MRGGRREKRGWCNDEEMKTRKERDAKRENYILRLLGPRFILQRRVGRELGVRTKLVGGPRGAMEVGVVWTRLWLGLD